MHRFTLILFHICLPIFSTFAHAAAAEEVVTCSTLYDISSDDITETNAQIFFQDAILCIPENDALREVALKHLLNMSQASYILGGSNDRFVATRLAIVTIERNGINLRSAPIAWQHTIAGLIAIQPPLDVRDYIYAISNVAIQQKIFEGLGRGSEVDLSSELLEEFVAPINKEFEHEVFPESNSGKQAICFVKSDIGGAVEATFASPRYIQCLNGR